MNVIIAKRRKLILLVYWIFKGDLIGYCLHVFFFFFVGHKIDHKTWYWTRVYHKRHDYHLSARLVTPLLTHCSQQCCIKPLIYKLCCPSFMNNYWSLVLNHWFVHVAVLISRSPMWSPWHLYNVGMYIVRNAGSERWWVHTISYGFPGALCDPLDICTVLACTLWGVLAQNAGEYTHN